MPDRAHKPPENYLAEMIARIQAGGSRITDFSAGSIARTLLEAWAQALSYHGAVADGITEDSYLATADGDSLDLKALDYFVTRKPGTQATGVIRITRAASGTSLVIPAGWGQLSTIPAPATDAVAVTTTEDASFGISDLYVDVSAQAVLVGAIGNLMAGTSLIPANPVVGIDSETGYAVQSTFTGGTDVELDEAFRARIQTEVQGRVNGTAKALEAAALSVNGVESVKLLAAGDARTGGGQVPAGSAEVYYEGSAGLLAEVQSAVDARAVLNQDVTCYTAAATDLYVALTVYANPGTDSTALATYVAQALKAAVNAVGVGGTVRQATAVNYVHGVPGLVAVSLPMTDFRKLSESSSTVHDVALDVEKYALLSDANISVAVTPLS